MEYIKLMLIPMLPVIELRGAIPLGIAMNLKPIYVYLSYLIGSSIVSVPIVLVFRQVIDYLRYRKYFNTSNNMGRYKNRKSFKKAKSSQYIRAYSICRSSTSNYGIMDW